MLQLMTTGSSNRLISRPPETRKTGRRGRGPRGFDRRESFYSAYSRIDRLSTTGHPPWVPFFRAPAPSYGHHPVLLPRALDSLARRHPQAPDDRGARLPRVDDVVDQVVVGGDVGDDDLPHRRPRHRVEHLCAMADDPGVLDLGADHEPGHVLEEDQWDVEGVAEVHEPGRLVG